MKSDGHVDIHMDMSCLYPTLPQTSDLILRPIQALIRFPAPPRSPPRPQRPGGVEKLETRNLWYCSQELGDKPDPHPCAAIILLKSRSSTSVIDHYIFTLFCYSISVQASASVIIRSTPYLSCIWTLLPSLLPDFFPPQKLP